MILKAILFLILVAIVGPFLRTLWGLGYQLHFHKHHPGKCRQIKRPGIGSEDFQILSSGVAFITTNILLPMAEPSFNNYSKLHGKGSIQFLDLSQPSVVEAKPLPIKHGKDFDPDNFHPHGLSVLEDKAKGEHLLYVISHAEDLPDRVEKFRYSPKSKELVHERSFTSDALFVTNDLAVVEEDKFYITNWMYFKSRHLSMLENIYQPPLGAVLFYNGTDFNTVSGRLFSPNGIMLSADKRHLYLALPMSKTMQVYRRYSDENIRFVQEVYLHTGLDNFHLSEKGDSLFGGCHPIGHKALFAFGKPGEFKTPAQVLQIPLKDGLVAGEDKIIEEFLDHGELISGSSVAGVYKNKMLIGSVIDSLVVCDLPKAA